MIRSVLPLPVVALLAGCVTLPQREQLASMPAPHVALPEAAAVADGRARFREIFCAVLDRHRVPDAGQRTCGEWLWQLGDEPAAAPRPLPAAASSLHVYMVSGAFNECLGEDAGLFGEASARLRDAGYRIESIIVSGRSGSERNAAQIAARLSAAPGEKPGPAVLIGYSKGANDILEFLVRYPELAARALAPVWRELLSYDARNDGQLLARDMLVPGSTLLGYVNADHWSVAVDVEKVHSVLGARRDPEPFPRAALLEAILLLVAETCDDAAGAAASGEPGS